jgi:hypothetical protein
MPAGRRRDGKFASKSELNQAADQEVAAVLPPTDLPSSRNPSYHPSDDGRQVENTPNPELEALREQNRLLTELLAEKGKAVSEQRQAAVDSQAPNVGPSGLPAGLYPERSTETTQARNLPRGLLAHEVIEMDRIAAEEQALDRIAAGLPPVPPPLPEGTVTASREEFEAKR